MTRIGLVPVFAVLLAASLAAQRVAPTVTRHGSWGRGLAHYGKWMSAALAVTFIGLGAREHASSDDAFGELLQTCRADTARCAIDPSGGYVNPASEALYQTSIHHARRARVRLLAAQASLLLAAGLFLADHGPGGEGPDNIPYSGLVFVDQDAGGARVGVRIKF